MSESSLAVSFLGVISGCLLVMAVTMVLMAVAFCRALRKLEAKLHDADDALRHARSSLRHVDRFFSRADRVSRHAETALDQVWATALEAWAHLGRLGEHVKALWGHHVGNGARAESRPHHRRWTGTRRRVVG